MILAILVAAVGAPVVYFSLDKIILKDNDGITVTDDSDSEFKYAWAQEFTLLAGQKATIIFSGSYTDITTHLKIFTKAEYDRQVEAGGVPGSVGGLDFVEVYVDYDDTSPDSNEGQTRSVVTNDPVESHFLEFAGSTDGGAFLDYIPGTYVVIVYGSNAGTSETIIFDITVKVDFPGRVISYFMVIGGISLIAVIALIFCFQWIRRMVR